MTAAKVQHYVPQFLLRNFGTGKKDQVFVFEKATGKIFTPNAKNIASESRFYDFQIDEQAVSLEPLLSKIESAAKPIFQAILDTDSLVALDTNARAVLADFFSVQLVRTRAFREQWAAFPRILRGHLEARGERVEPGSQAEGLLSELSENDLKAQTGTFLVNAPRSFAVHFSTKIWGLAATSKRDPFILGDHPLAMQNMHDLSPRGNLGLTTPGIEIYFPMSPVRALVLWCPTLANAVFSGADKLRRMPPWMVKDRIEHPEEILTLDAALRGGTPIPYRSKNVENFNSLQVAWSERYLFADADHFDLARTMLREHPGLKKGPRMQMN